jgi:hypothetical protein
VCPDMICFMETPQMLRGLPISSTHTLRGRTASSRQFSPRRQKFTPDEDQRLIRIVSIMPELDWALVAGYLQARTARQCRERWRMYLDPHFTTAPWTPDEDAILVQQHAIVGSWWAAIAELLPGRTPIQVKNRWVTVNRIRRKCASTGRSRKARGSGSGETPMISHPQLPPISQIWPDSALVAGHGPIAFRWEGFKGWAGSASKGQAADVTDHP